MPKHPECISVWDDLTNEQIIATWKKDGLSFICEHGTRWSGPAIMKERNKRNKKRKSA